MINFNRIIFLLLLFLVANSVCSETSPAKWFNHTNHEENAFKKLNIKCSDCHNFSINPDGVTATASPNLKQSNFKAGMKTLCHQCHQSQDIKQKISPQTCIVCHSENDSLKSIKPLDHENLSFKSNHSLLARVQGSRCMNCHIPSQCVKCHLNRNDIEMNNHSRNFRFTHSILARGQPHRCETCHTQNYCIKCHIGK